MLPDLAFARFNQFGQYSLDLEVFAYLATTNYFESLEIAEDLHLRIMDLLAAAGSELGIPVHIEYKAVGATLDGGRVLASEGQVKEWKERGRCASRIFPKRRLPSCAVRWTIRARGLRAEQPRQVENRIDAFGARARQEAYPRPAQ